MAIAFRRYIDITSGVGGGAGVRTRDLIGRLFTTNPLLPTGSFIEFSSAEDVADYFGASSDEYLRAAFYFGWVSKNISRPQKISFARWTDDDVAPRIYGFPGTQTVGTWSAISAGTFYLTLGEDSDLGPNKQLIGPIDFSAVSSLADVAAAIQSAIRAAYGTSLWTAATVVWNSTRMSFDFLGGDVGTAEIDVDVGTGDTDIADQLNWLASTGGILSAGADEETVTETLIASAQASDNFGSFLFIPELDDDQILEAAIWNDDQNVKFQYCLRTTAANSSTLSEALLGYAGIAMTLAPLDEEYPEQVPMMILAATDYSKVNSVQNYMFQIFTLTPSVNKTSDADIYDPLRVNYYGRTQTAGQFVDFYQRGVLTGLPTDPVDQNVYANEQWLKDAAGSAIMTLLLSLARVPANAKGRSQILAVVQSVVDQALRNGTISVGKPLNTTQKLYIGEITGDDLAWHQVQNIGYWVDCVITSFVTSDDRTEYKATYTLVYSKDDAIRKVEGTHVLI